MLRSMTPKLHRQFENVSPYEMLQEFKSMFEKQVGVEWFDLIQTFHACKQEEGKPVGPYVIKMKNYVAQLERLGYVLPQDLSVGLILNGLTRFYFKKAATPQVMAIQSGRIQRANKKSLNAKRKGKGKGKGKDKSYIPKPNNKKTKKTLNLLLKEHPAKDDTCHHCKEVGHCKRNCPAYLAELIKKKKQVGTASSSDIFIIELFSFPYKSWVYDTGCDTHILEAIGSYDLVLPNGLVICLNNCHYAPSITRGVVSVSRLVENGFVQCFMDFGISVSKNNVVYLTVITSMLILLHTHIGVLQRRNRTLLDMVRSMMNLTTLPLFFWDYALESATRILKMVPTKKVDKTPYELWYGKVPNLSYLKVWGCEALVKRDTPDKLQQRSVKCIFIGYPKETMGYYFYFPLENKIVVARYAEFFEKILNKKSVGGP
ncbi:retrotransposon protein, putative, ty1-copia subclass [Tanacetum coccineum]